MSVFIIQFLLSGSAFAQVSLPQVRCQFPEGAYSAALLKVEPDVVNGDAVLLELFDGDKVERAFKTLTRNGAVARQLRRGRLQIVLRGEKGRSSATVTTDAALLVLDRAFDGRFMGRLAARGSVFEIVCD